MTATGQEKEEGTAERGRTHEQVGSFTVTTAFLSLRKVAGWLRRRPELIARGKKENSLTIQGRGEGKRPRRKKRVGHQGGYIAEIENP